MGSDKSKLPTRSTNAEVEAFLRKAHNVPLPGDASSGGGRLLFAMDATASREPTWVQACQIQAEMFSATKELGGLEVKLCFFRGFKELRASEWCSDSSKLQAYMTRVRCAAGITQIGRVLDYGIAQTTERRVNALVYVGDCMEESRDKLADRAGQLGVLGVPVFVFHEGYDAIAELSFREIARLSRGAYCRFEAGSAGQLKDLLGAVAAYAAGGFGALERFGEHRGELAQQVIRQLALDPE